MKWRTLKTASVLATLALFILTGLVFAGYASNTFLIGAPPLALVQWLPDLVGWWRNG